MPEETGDSVVAAEAGASATAESPEFESPPPAPIAQRVEADPRARLHELAIELVRSQNRRLLVEYLRLRRAAV
jgi:hypothetical protein